LITFDLDLPEELGVAEVVVESTANLRSKDRLMVTDGFTVAYFPRKKIYQKGHSRPLEEAQASDHHESGILRRLIERVLELKIKQVTGRPLLHGLYLLDEPARYLPVNRPRCTWLHCQGKTSRWQDRH